MRMNSQLKRRDTAQSRARMENVVSSSAPSDDASTDNNVVHGKQTSLKANKAGGASWARRPSFAGAGAGPQRSKSGQFSPGSGNKFFVFGSAAKEPGASPLGRGSATLKGSPPKSPAKTPGVPSPKKLASSQAAFSFAQRSKGGRSPNDDWGKSPKSRKSWGAGSPNRRLTGRSRSYLSRRKQSSIQSEKQGSMANDQIGHSCDLESQMDDFMIEQESRDSDASSSSCEYISDSYDDESDYDARGSKRRPISNSPTQSDPSMSASSSDSEALAHDPEAKIQQRMEDYYKKNYKKYVVYQGSNFFQERVWNVFYDETYDLLYVFTAKIEQIRGEKLMRIEIESKANGEVSKSTLVQCMQHQGGQKFNIKQQNDNKSPESCNSQCNMTGEYALEERALQVYQNCEVLLDLQLQIWNVDDRKMRDKDHRMKPQSQLPVLKKKVFIAEQMSTFNHMNHIQNLYQDYAQLLQNDSKIHFFSGEDRLVTYNTKTKIVTRRNIKDTEEPKNGIRISTALLHFKDIGKKTQFVESILQISYQQFEKLKDEGSKTNPGDRSSVDLNRQSSQAGVKKYRQMISIKIFSYKSISEQQKNVKRIKQAKFKESNTNNGFKDDILCQYYENKQKRRLQPFLFQRILDSNTYILLFPTGLLLMIVVNPIVIQARLQLNLRKDEPLIDYTYNISNNQRNHCIWMMDEKLQVWKCTNELAPNSCNWTLVKISMYDNLFYKKFLAPANTYDDYYMTTSLNKLKCFKGIRLKSKIPQDFLFAYNGSVARAIVVKQPNLINDQIQQDEKKHRADNSVETYLKENLNVNRHQLEGNYVTICLIAKNQNIILNLIPERKSMMNLLKISFDQQVSSLAEQLRAQVVRAAQQDEALRGSVQLLDDKKGASRKQQEQVNDIFRRDNEIMELLYMGKSLEPTLDTANFKAGNQVESGGEDPTPILTPDTEKIDNKKYVRKFLVRRKRQLELMFTNGLNHWTVYIMESAVDEPFHISDIKLSDDNRTIIVYYSLSSNEQQYFIRTFRATENNTFMPYEDDLIQGKQATRNLTFDNDCKLFETKIDLSTTRKAQNKPFTNIFVEREQQMLHIRIPKCIFYKELFDQRNFLARVMQSGDRRLLMCGKVLIQLNEALDEIDNIGVIEVDKEHHQSIRYKFLSLIKQEDRGEILRIAKANQGGLVYFDPDKEPVSPSDQPNVLYILCCIDERSGDTSLIKLRTDTLECFCIYQSKFKIMHLAIQVRKSTEGSSPARQFDQSMSNESSVREEQELSKLVKVKGHDIGGTGSASPTPSPRRPDDRYQLKQRMKAREKRHKNCKIYLSLLSQSKNHINMEILADEEHPNNDDLLSDEMNYSGERNNEAAQQQAGTG